MKPRKINLDSLQVNRPCASDWEGMAGDDRTRFCAACGKQVYNLSSMTRREIETLVHDTGGKFCARVIRDMDGSLATASPNAGLNLIKLRASRIAGAVVTATLTLSQNVIAQTSLKPNRPNNIQSVRQSKDVIKPNILGQSGGVKGTVYDQQRAVIAGATVKIKNKKTDEEFSTISSEDGVFNFASLPLGSYDLIVDAPGFVRNQIENINLTDGVSLNIELTVQVGSQGGVVFVDEVIEPTPIPQRLMNPIKAIKQLVKRPKN